MSQIVSAQFEVAEALAFDEGVGSRSRSARRRRKILKSMMRSLEHARVACLNGASGDVIDGMLRGSAGDLLSHGKIAGEPVATAVISLMASIR